MLIAINHQHQQITAHKDLSKQDHYSCPACQSPVHLKAGSVMRPHFAHFKKAHCAVFSEGETEEHILGKQQMYDWLKSKGYPVEMEAYLPELMQRPDLLMKWKNQDIAIEFQCSSLSIEKLSARTEGYINKGYKVIWILGEQFTYQRKLTAFQKACLANIENHLVLFHYSVSKKRLEYRYDFQLNQIQKTIEVKRILQAESYLKIDLKRKSAKLNIKLDIEIEHKKLQRQLHYTNANTQEFLQTLYKNNETLISMPKELYEVVPNDWLIQTNPFKWKLECLLWLESHKPDTVITPKKLLNWIKGINYYEIPQLSNKQKLKPILEFLQVLNRTSVVRQFRFDKWIFNQPAKRYKFLEDKF